MDCVFATLNHTTFQRAHTVPHRDDDTGHVENVRGHLERERFVELWRHVTLDDVRSPRLDCRVLTHHADLRVEVCQ